MLDALRRTLRLVAALLRTTLLIGLQYRADFVLEGVTGLFRTAAGVAPLWLVYDHKSVVVGWDLPDAAMVLALFLLLRAVSEGLIDPNLGAVVDAVRTGSFDLVLLRPADAQLLVSLQRIAPARIWDAAAAVAIGAWSLASRPPPSGLDVLVAAGLLAAGVAAIYSLSLLTVCLSFRFVRVDNLRYLLASTLDAGRWPIEVFTGWVRWVLTVVVPVALFTSFPAMALRGTWDARLLGTAAAVSLTFVVVSRWVWVRSLARYTSASS